MTINVQMDNILVAELKSFSIGKRFATEKFLHSGPWSQLQDLETTE